MNPSEPHISLIAAAVLVVLLTGGCDRAPQTGSSSTPIAVTGREEIAWDEAAISVRQLTRYHYIAYVDDVPQDLAEARCGLTPTNGTFPCTSKLPKMSPGPHRLQVAAEEMDDKHRRSRRSDTLLLDVRPSDTK